MHCSKCGSEYRAGTKFCAECGARLPQGCSHCGADNAPTAKFCGECGAQLRPSASDPVSKLPPVQTSEIVGERRHLTVLFCDLVGSTAMAAQLDPEEWRETVSGYQRAAAEAITRFDGYVAKYLGDGVMAFFGYPQAHDNDAERAVRAGLAILDAIAKLNQQPTHAKLSARVGIDSGAVVVGKGAGQDADVFGDAPNIAARVQEAAPPGTVLITDSTHRLVSGLFLVEDRGAQQLKGIERPVQLYRVVQPSGVRGRFAATAAVHGMTPFVGREDEARLLMNRWERVRDGEGQVVTIVGEAGIGKSRLVQHFRKQIAATPHTWLECITAAFFQNTPFYAITEMLRQSFLWEQRFRALKASLAAPGTTPGAAVSPLIASLLELPAGAQASPSALPPEQQRKQLLAALVAWTHEIAKAQPLVIATEDLHWADPSTLELTQLLVEQGATAPLMLLYTARPEFQAQWPSRAHHTQITLNRLSSRDVRTIVGQVAAQKALSDETIAAVVERTSGVPLFVEELTRAVLEGGDAQLSGREIPVTLHDSLMARLDRLGPAKEVAQIGAVIGGEFSYELLRAVDPIDEEELQRALRALADAELLYVRGIAPDVTYQFKHALIRDAAYEALLKSRRRDLHQLVARTINEKFPRLKETQPEVLARHWTEAGEIEFAINEWLRAGKVAETRYAFREALGNYEQAVALLNLLPESPERDSRELELKQSVVRMLWMTKGYAAPETNEAIKGAATLAEHSGNLTQLVNLMVSKSLTTFSSGDLFGASILADQLLELARREGSAISFGLAHELQIFTRHWRGDLASVEMHFTEGLKFFDDPSFRQFSAAAVATFGTASWNAWTVGRADVALEREAQMTAATNVNNPYQLAFSKYFAASLQVRMREYEQGEMLAAQALELSENHQFPWLAALCRGFLGEARA
jgi:class 3 adenylate cyclase